MATFIDEPALPTTERAWARIKSLLLTGKTVELYRRTQEGQMEVWLRIWTGKREDGSNLVDADPDEDY